MNNEFEFRTPTTLGDCVSIVGEIKTLVSSYEDVLRLKKEYEDEMDAKKEKELAFKHRRLIPEIKKVIFNAPATIVVWEDGEKTIVKCQEGDEYDEEKGLALCIAKRSLGNKGNFNDELIRFLSE